jgi:hypothetical protein
MSLLTVAVIGLVVPAATALAPSGPALYLPFDDGVNPTHNVAAPTDGSLQPVAGPTFSTDAPPVDGNVRSLAFDGVHDYVSVASYPALEPAGGFTVSLWAKSSDPGTGNRYLIVKGAQGSSAGTYSLYTTGGNLYFDVFDWLGGPYLYAATAPATGVWDGSWHNITGVFAPGSIELFVDGMSNGTGSVSFSPDFNLGEDALTIGDYNPVGIPGSIFNFAGKLDEVFFYGRSLSAFEVKCLADRHSVLSAKVGGAIVAHDATTMLAVTDKSEPDFAFDGVLYKGALGTVWGSVSVNYKLLGPKTCTFTPDGLTTMTLLTAPDPDRVDVQNILNSCDGGRYTIQLMERGDAKLPRGGVFISQMPGDYTISSAYELESVATVPYDWYVPFDRGNVIFGNGA